ncbi:MAG: LysR family transcriptional regulator [Intestinibacillus sp.]
MTIWHLKLFVDVAELGGMSAAAAKNKIRQPSVSQKIAELEKHYGVLLFERMGNRLMITESGKKLLEMARDVVSRYDFLEEFMEEEHHRRRLRIGATLTVGSSIFARLMQRFCAENPEVEVYGTIGNTAAICEKLLKNELDIALVEGEVREPELTSVPKLQDFLMLACGRGHPFYDRTEVYSHELDGMAFVMREQGSGTRELFERYAARHGLKIRTMLEYSCPEAIRQAVCINGCLAVLSARLLEKAAQDGSIRLFRSEGPDWDRTFDIVYPKNKHISVPIRRFCELLERYRELETVAVCDAGLLKNG